MCVCVCMHKRLYVVRAEAVYRYWRRASSAKSEYEKLIYETPPHPDKLAKMAIVQKFLINVSRWRGAGGAGPDIPPTRKEEPRCTRIKFHAKLTYKSFARSIPRMYFLCSSLSYLACNLNYREHNHRVCRSITSINFNHWCICAVTMNNYDFNSNYICNHLLEKKELVAKRFKRSIQCNVPQKWRRNNNKRKMLMFCNTNI